MSPDETLVLDAIRAADAALFHNWFARQPIGLASVMAFVTVESAFKQFARRYEPALDDASYGYLQILSQTAKSIGYQGPCFPHMPDPPYDAAKIKGSLYDPAENIKWGMTYLNHNWMHLQAQRGGAMTLAMWADSYNRGPGGSNLGWSGHPYVRLWNAAREHWKEQGV